MLFKPYYEVFAWSPSKKKIQNFHLSTEMDIKKKCVKLEVAKDRAINFAKSLNEKKMLNASDWVGRIQLVTDNGKYPVQF